jgi:hypothetical protein
VLITAGAGVLGLVAAFCIPFVWLWLTAPRRQRDEAREALLTPPPPETELVIDEVRCEFSRSNTPDQVTLNPALMLRNTTLERLRWNVVHLSLYYGVSSNRTTSLGGALQAGGGQATGIIEPGATELQPLDVVTVPPQTHSLRVDVVIKYGPTGIESELQERLYVEFVQRPREEFPTVAFQVHLRPAQADALAVV